MDDLPLIINRPRPTDLPSHPHLENTPEAVARILNIPDDELDSRDYEVLRALSQIAGSYDDMVYFLPHAIKHVLREVENCGSSFETISFVVEFISSHAEKMMHDGISDLSRICVNKMLEDWTSNFIVIHRGISECTAIGSCADHLDDVKHSDVVCEMLEALVRNKTHADLAVQLVRSCVNHGGNKVRAAWHLELARQRLRGLVTLNNPDIYEVLNDDYALQESAAVLLPDVLQADHVSTYWDDTFKLLRL